jgi:exonuclease III
MSKLYFSTRSLNANGLNKAKTYDILNEIKDKKIDIFAIQHVNTKNWKTKDLENTINRAGKKAITNVTDDQNQTGIIIIVKNEIKIKILYKDKNNRILGVRIKRDNVYLNLYIVYGIPNQQDNPNKLFYKELDLALKKCQDQNVTIMGDFNAVCDINKEIESESSNINRPADKYYKKLLEEFRESEPIGEDEERFTFFKGNYKARLDHCIFKGNHSIKNVKYERSITESDHWEIQCEIEGTIREEEATETTTEEAPRPKRVIDKDKLKEDQETTKTIKNKIKEFYHRNPDTKVEALVKLTREITLDYAGKNILSQKKENKNYFSHDIFRWKEQKKKLLNWNNKINKYKFKEEFPLGKITEIASEFPDVLISTTEAQEQIQEQIKETNGKIKRKKEEKINEFLKKKETEMFHDRFVNPKKYYEKMKKTNKTKKLDQIEINGEIITDERKIAEEAHRIYKSLYQKPEDKEEDTRPWTEERYYTDVTNKEENSLTADITLEELKEIINQMPNNKAGGIDETPYELIKLWDEEILKNVLEENEWIRNKHVPKELKIES